MAKKVTKNTLGSKYAEILSRQGINMNDCTVLCFKFDSINIANNFHFALMIEHLSYLLYDGATEIVNIIVKRQDKLIQDMIRRIAEEYKGEERIAKID